MGGMAMLVALLIGDSVATAVAPPHYTQDLAFKPVYAANASAVTGVSACAVGTGSDPHVYVGQRGKGAPPILVMDKTGKVLRGFGEGLVGNMHGMHMQSVGGKQFLWITDTRGSKVSKFDPASGKLLASLGSHGTGLHPEIQFGSVADVAFDASGAVYISDGDGGVDSRIMKLDSSLKLEWAVGNNGTVTPAATPFASPHSLDYDPTTHRVFVADRNHNRIRAFDAATGAEVPGAWTAVFASAHCENPAVWSVRVDASAGKIFVANSNFGSGSNCPAVPATAHSGRVAIIPLPKTKGNLVEPPIASVGFASLQHGFPHEICVDARDGAIFAAAVDAADLPPATGIGALTKYTVAKSD
jgi:hypothetical protein|eukprot:COSAG06_NODE_4356_length_4332_cov_2.994330_2_plen_357_part_00